jgi:hypothetical protein
VRFSLRYHLEVYRAITCLAVLLWVAPLHAYSVFSHEAIIDTVWDGDLKPLLLRRFPGSTPEELIQAHAHAYGGCIIQDMGYYPFGSKLFSDLVHYVRTGEFIINLLREAATLDEYAFALGSLAHYAADTQGHGVAVNPSVPMEYPELKKKFGNIVTYADDKLSHLRVEFSFDVLQIARGSYAPQSYHDFIGFQVSKDVLNRALQDTYSLELKDLFGELDLAIATYRYSVSSVLPKMTKVAWQLKKDELVKARPGITRRRYVYNLSKASFQKEWSGKVKKPGVGTRIFAFIINILPKFGPLTSLKFMPPTPQVATLFETSFNRTIDEYRHLIADEASGRLVLPDADFDTGRPTAPVEYRLADDAYAALARRVAEPKRPPPNPKLLKNILHFFDDLSRPFATKSDPEKWQKTAEAIIWLRGL